MRRLVGAPVAAAAILLLAMAAGSRPAAAADEITVRAVVDRARIGDNDQVVLSVEVAAQSFEQVGPPDVSRLADFEILSGPALASRFQWINGRTSSTRTYSYVLRPRKTGTLTIPSLGMLIQGRTYHTQAIDVDVVARGGAASPSAPPPGGVRHGPGALPAPPDRTAAGAADVMVRAEVDRRTAYVGQQVTLRLVLLTRTEVLNLGLKEAPSFPGFWAEEIKVPENLEVRRVQQEGATWGEYTLMKKALFPTGTGTVTIPPVAYQIQVRRRSVDPIESFFFTPTETIVRRTDPMTVTVLPLPEDRPPGFSGAVGSFTLAVDVDRRDTKVNDALGVKVRVAGEGNLNAVTSPPLADLSDFKQYAPKVTSSTTTQGDRVRGEKTWDYVLIPLAAGAQAIPRVDFTYFDPAARAYRTVSSPPVPVQVARSDDRTGPALAPVSQSDVRQVRRDIHFIKQASRGLADRSGVLYRTPLFAVLVTLPVVADLGILAFVRRRGARAAGAGSRRERRARALARRRLKEARRSMTPAQARAFHAAVAGALTGYVADKFGVAPSGLTHDRIEELLAGRGVPDAVRTGYHRCLEACDYARFAPATPGAGEMESALATAEQTLVDLERSLPA